MNAYHTAISIYIYRISLNKRPGRLFKNWTPRGGGGSLFKGGGGRLFEGGGGGRIFKEIRYLH